MGMESAARLLPMLLMAIALMLLARAETDSPTDTQDKASAALIGPVISIGTLRMGRPCRGCNMRACSMEVVSCGASCATGCALAAETILLTTVFSEANRSGTPPAVRDRHRSPDPYPPRSTGIS